MVSLSETTSYSPAPHSAQALATVLTRQITNLGELRVVDTQGNVFKSEKASDFIQLAQLAYAAFQNNPFFKKSYPFSPLGIKPDCTLVEFKPQVIQVPEDNIGNPYGSNSYVAADVFALFVNANAGGFTNALRVTTGP